MRRSHARDHAVAIWAAATDNEGMKKLVAILLFTCTACSTQGANVAIQSTGLVAQVAATAAERRRVLEHRRIVQRDLAILKAGQRARFARPQPSPGRTLGLELVVRLDQRLDLEVAQQSYLELDGHERARCVAVFKEKAPNTPQAQAVLQVLQSAGQADSAPAGRAVQHSEFAP